jgi:hypothetical protein
MTRSHVLLHYPNDRLGAGIGRQRPRRSSRLLKFLELSGVGRTMADGTDEDGARATAMDEWIVVGDEGEGRPRGLNCITFSFLSFTLLGGLIL